MKKEDIKDLWDLARYINELDEWDRDIEEICKAKGWKYYDDSPWYIAQHDGWFVVFADDGCADVVKFEDEDEECGYDEEDED